MKIKKEIEFWEKAIVILKSGYGNGCKTKDTDDFPDLKDNPKSRCACCRAKETIDFIKDHIKLIKLR